MHVNTKYLFDSYASRYFSPDKRVLEVGIKVDGEVIAPSALWHTADIDAEAKPTFVCEEYSIPVPGNSYDIVYSANTLEHVRMPWLWVPELVRVCAPGGRIILIVPVNWGYHEDPVDCWRVLPEGMRALLLYSGLTDILFAMHTNPFGAIDTFGTGVKP